MSKKGIIIGILALSSLSFMLIAQESASSGIVGQVNDSSQAGVPGAMVTVTNVGTNAKRSGTTDTNGGFSIPNLPAATYQIRVEKSGFQASVLNNFELL